MRNFLFALLVLVGTVATTFAATYRVDQVPNVQLADRTRYVSNPDGILSVTAVAQIDSICGALRVFEGGFQLLSNITAELNAENANKVI